jgi:hypothetical protein
MIAVGIINLLCVDGIGFYLRFLLALHGEIRPIWRGAWLYSELDFEEVVTDVAACDVPFSGSVAHSDYTVADQPTLSLLEKT